MKTIKQHLMTVILVNVALICVRPGFADATQLSIPEILASPGDLVNTSVSYSAEGAQVSALQFDLLRNPSILSITTATAGSAATAAGKILDFNLNVSSGNSRFLIYGLNQNVIGDGSVADLTIQVSNNAPVGPYGLTLFNAIGADPDANFVPITVINAGPVIPEPASLWLLGSCLTGLAMWRGLKHFRSEARAGINFFVKANRDHHPWHGATMRNRP